jgi:hypothetical protein
VSRPLNFGPYSKFGGLSFEEYVLNALNRIERWTHDVATTDDLASTAVTTSLITEDSDYLLKESGTGIGLES